MLLAVDDSTLNSTTNSTVGVGFLPSSSVGSSSTLPSVDPDDEVIENLEDDERVTGEVHEFALAHTSRYMTVLLFCSP